MSPSCTRSPTFDNHLTASLDSRLAAVVEEVLALDDLGTDEALLEVGVDAAAARGALLPRGVGPGTHLLHPSGGKSPDRGACKRP